MSEFSELCSALKNLKSALITFHVAPDPDAVGSSCALALGLALLGIETAIYSADTVPERIKPFVGNLRVYNSLPEKKFECLVVLDTATTKRISGESEEIFSTAEKSINIDHHVSNKAWADINYVDSTAASSASIVFQILKELKVQISSDCATLMLAGLMDDTGCFRFSNTTAEAFLCAAELVSLGASPERIANALYYSLPHRVLKLRSLAMSNLRLVADGKVGLVRVTKELLESCSARPEDAEGIIDEVRSIEGTLGAVFAREMDEGLWKFSLRSKDSRFDVNKVASQFGGGGHQAAAGCRIDGAYEAVEAKLLAAVEAEFKK